MTKMAPAEALAAELRDQLATHGPEAMVAALSERYGDKVAVTHEPPSHADGLVDGAMLRANYRAHTAAVAKTLADFRLEGAITSDTDSVTTHLTLSGGTPDGTRAEYTVEETFTLDGESIVAFHAKGDPVQGAAFFTALMASGFTVAPA